MTQHVLRLLFIICITGALSAACAASEVPGQQIDEQVTRQMKQGKIPGLSLVMIKKGRLTIRSYGYANAELRTPVTPYTLFEIGSCSKAFVALAILDLANREKIDLDSSVSAYLPWFYARYRDSIVTVTLRQLLHQTSGIPWETIGLIPESADSNALDQTIKRLTGVRLRRLPGKGYEYATINYDVLALVIEKVTGKPFDDYLQQHIFQKLGMVHTAVGVPSDSSAMASGHKISFFRPRVYAAPVYKGNYAAGYIISNAVDMARWLRFQMAADSSLLSRLARATQQRDEKVPLHNMASYAMGWEVSLNGNGEIYHGGQNPNFTSYVAFRSEDSTGVVVLANSNSSSTAAIGETVMKLLSGEPLPKTNVPDDGNDKVFSLLSAVIGIYVLGALVFLCIAIGGIAGGKRKYAGISYRQVWRAMAALFLTAPFLFGIYLLPEALGGFSWKTVAVWTPMSFTALIVLILAAIAVSGLVYVVRLVFPEKNIFRRTVPSLILISILSGLANMLIIILVTSALETALPLRYLVFYYVLALGMYLLGRRFVQVSLIRLTRKLVYDLQIKLIDRIFASTFQKFERIDRGRIYTALNDDVTTIGESTSMLVTLITSIFTAAGAFLYLASIAFWATVLTVLLVAAISILYFLVSKTTNRYFEAARDMRNVFIHLINGMVDGFKEISIRRKKKLAYKADISGTTGDYRDRLIKADVRFVHAFLVGESLLVALLGLVAFAFPRIFPDIQRYVIMNFIILLLYLIGPVNAILGSVPAILHLRIAWNRVRRFTAELPAGQGEELLPGPHEPVVNSIGLEGVCFGYKDEQEQLLFSVGPINLEARKGEVLFIIGGNGSGKTTLAKLLSGLYEPDEGRLLVNGKPVNSRQLSEYFSVVFSPAHLFRKLYDIDLKGRQEEVDNYLKILKLEGKVTINEDIYSTIELSGGQRKRLALLQCYLEDSPVYLFDEWAADQDPEYRNFFYRTLLPEMKRQGRIIIAITHDDHYFDVADRVFKMTQGRLELYRNEYPLHEVLSENITIPLFNRKNK